MSHLRAPDGTVLCEHPEPHNEDLSALRLVDDELLALSGPLFDGLYEYRRLALATGREPA